MWSTINLFTLFVFSYQDVKIMVCHTIKHRGGNFTITPMSYTLPPHSNSYTKSNRCSFCLQCMRSLTPELKYHKVIPDILKGTQVTFHIHPVDSRTFIIGHVSFTWSILNSIKKLGCFIITMIRVMMVIFREIAYYKNQPFSTIMMLLPKFKQHQTISNP